ncbi:cache domain-containing protein [Amphritea sp. HPY]|uniref:cache domain-containing protein n=1 Tax=Amphritea sp. HPY TaxID=3421652 RepID=UPI003D7D99D6
MFRSKIFLKTLLVILLIVFTNAGFITFFTIPIVKNNAYSLEEKLAKSMLSKASDTVNNTYIELESFKQNANAIIRKNLRNMALLVEGVINQRYLKFRAGDISEQTAKQLAMEDVRALRYGDNGYFWLNDFDFIMLMHPILPELEGQDLVDLKDENEVYLMREFVNVIKENNAGEGYVGYSWPKPGETDPQPKLSYVRSFDPWQWILGTGVYIDEIDKAIALKKLRLVERLIDEMKNTVIGKSGYMFIFDAEQNVIYHPNVTENRLAGISSPATEKRLVNELIKASGTPDLPFEYIWDKPGDPGNYAYDKIGWVRYFEPLGWYVVASAYVAELDESASKVKNIVLTITAIVLIASLTFGYIFFWRLLNPINTLAELVQRVHDGDFDVRSNIKRDDEIGILASEFDDMVSKLKDHIQNLDRKVAEKTEELQSKNSILEIIPEKLSRYLPPQIYESIFQGERDVEITTERKKLTVFFSDIEDFTATTEEMQPEDLTVLLNEYFSEMSAIATRHGGTIDKFVGDAMLIFFGDPESKGVQQDAISCVKMAIEMQQKMAELQARWLQTGYKNPFHMRVGINSGYCNVGNFGSNERMDYTIIGEEVNLAARLQSAADPDGIMISYETYALVKDFFSAEEQTPIHAKGIQREIRPYALTGIFDQALLESTFIRKEQNGMLVVIDLDKMTEQDRKQARTEMENIIQKLKK